MAIGGAVVIGDDAVERVLDELLRTLLRALTDASDAGRLSSAEARAVALGICRHLLADVCGALSDPLVRMRALTERVELLEAFVAADADGADTR